MVIRIGLAMLQGARHEHAQALYNAADELKLEIEVIPLRSKADIIGEKIDGIVLPGGESTTMRKASENHGLLSSLFDYIDDNSKVPVLGTCAGAILLLNPQMGRSRYIDADVNRNAFGSQKHSFQSILKLNEIEFPSIIEVGSSKKNIVESNHVPLLVEELDEIKNQEKFPGVFIRAPRFEKIEENVKKVVFYKDEAVGLMQGNKLALSFHPELTNDYRFHRWLLSKAKERINSGDPYYN